LFLGGLLTRGPIVQGRLGSSCLVLVLSPGGVGLPLLALALARHALVDLVHRLEGALDALFAFGGGALARRTHAASAGTRVVTTSSFNA